MKILVIDDEAHLLKLLVLGLEARGFEVLAAESGEEGLRKLAEHEDGGQGVGVVITDYKMSKMNGVEVLQMIKKTHQHINVVVMSGTMTDTIEDMVTLYGGSFSMQKPFRVDDLVTKLSDVIKAQTA